MGDPSTDQAEREPRGARRKRETRRKLLASAFQLIAERGVDAVAINEITEAADVGFGSFYNHFASKEAIYDEVFRLVFEEFGDALERITSDVKDAAEVVAVCVRHTVLRAQAEPQWGRFLLRESLTANGMTRGLAARLLRDIRVGVAQKRFVAADPLMALLMAGGTVMSGIAFQLASASSTGGLEPQGVDGKDFAGRVAATVLHGLGVKTKVAERIARLPLPDVAVDVSAFASDAPQR